jgi:adenylate cyclase
VFEPRPDLSLDQRQMIAALVAAHQSGNNSALVTHATAARQNFSQDPAILFLLDRLEQTQQGESYVLA